MEGKVRRDSVIVVCPLDNLMSSHSMWKGGRAARMATATHREQHAFCRLLTRLLHIQCQL